MIDSSEPQFDAPAGLMATTLRDRPADAVPQLGIGDLAHVNRPSIRCRAWMSATAPVVDVLRNGERILVIRDPERSGGSRWVKVQRSGGSTCGFVNIDFLDPAEPRRLPRVFRPASEPGNGTSSPPSSPIRTVATGTRTRLRSGPGTAFPDVCVLPPNTLCQLLAGRALSDDGFWVEIQTHERTGWIAERLTRPRAVSNRWIEVDLTRQALIGWSSDHPALVSAVSTGKPGFRTPCGIYAIGAKYPARRVRGTVNGETWDIPGVPWIMVFREGGFYFHGAYWHDDFGKPVSHGCVTVPVQFAERLYDWTPPDAVVWIHE